MSITVNEELKSLIFPLSDEERHQLEENIRHDGCRDPLTVWGEVLLDGHNRFEICTRLGIKYKTVSIDLADMDAAKDWMDANQLGRRNLPPQQMSLLRGRIYNRSKKARGGTGANQHKEQNGQNVQSAPTHESLGNRFGVSGKTVQRDGKFAEQVESLKQHVPDIEQRVMSGEVNRHQIADAAIHPDKAVESLKHVHVSANSGNNEWYTPPVFIEAARSVMEGITTDPATSDFANKNVKADTIFTSETDGRDKKWTGNVWLNPPYSQPLISDFAQAVTRKYQESEIDQACILVNNATETAWFHVMMQASSAVCFFRGRIKYLDYQGNPVNTPLQGQCAIYMGLNVEKFKEVFSKLGKVMINE